MKILHIIYDDVHNPWCGGGGAYRTATVNASIAAENPVTVLTGSFPGGRNETIDGVDYVRVGLPCSYLISRISFTLLVPFQVRKYACDIVVNDCSFFAPCFADLYVKQPVVNIIHHLMGNHAFKLHSLLGLFPFVAERLFLKLSRYILTSSKAVKERIETCTAGKRIQNIPNGIARDLLELAPEERNFVLFLGRIDLYMKGLDILLEAFAGIDSSDVMLKIAGSGKKGDMNKLVGMIRRLELEKRVEYLGKVDQNEKYELLRSCLFLAMPSRFEGWGITAVEANAAGKAVLGTRIPGLSEAVVHGQTALLVAPGDVAQLAAHLDMLIADKELRQALGKEGRTWARRFSWPAICARQYDFYQTVLGASSRALAKPLLRADI